MNQDTFERLLSGWTICGYSVVGTLLVLAMIAVVCGVPVAALCCACGWKLAALACVPASVVAVKVFRAYL